MTIPIERLRSLRWGLELIEAMQLDQTVPEPLREQAAELQPSYPTPANLIMLLIEDAETLPMPYANAIEAAGRLFNRLAISHQGTETTRHHLLYTERHFPLPGDAQFMATYGAFGGLASWIACEP